MSLGISSRDKGPHWTAVLMANNDGGIKIITILVVFDIFVPCGIF